MANVDLPNGFKVAMTMDGSPPPMFTKYLKSNVSVVPGDALKLLSTNVLDIATAADTGIIGVSQSSVTGVAATQALCQFIPALDTIVWEGQCSGTFTPVNVGESVDIEGTTGIMEINENAQSTGVARLIGLATSKNNAAGANARVWFTWVKSQWHGQA